jgi:hypothetical protein
MIDIWHLGIIIIWLIEVIENIEIGVCQISKEKIGLSFIAIDDAYVIKYLKTVDSLNTNHFVSKVRGNKYQQN